MRNLLGELVDDRVLRRVRPPVKWAGGKGQLLPQFRPLFPKAQSYYLEPFVGGGAVFFHLLPEAAVLIDNNPELINFYLVARDSPRALIEDLRKHENTPAYYYEIRSLDPRAMDPIRKASRFLYLNKTGYNGLWRVNQQGRHNVPFGRYKNPTIVDEDNLYRVSSALRHAAVLFGDFSLVLRFTRPGAFVYMDPPYDPLSDSACFTSYTSEAFGAADQLRLAGTFRELDRRGCLVMLSNSDTPLVRNLYAGYDIRVVYARRPISCRGDKRGPVCDLVIRNYSGEG